MPMNRTEALTHKWLIAQGYRPEDISFQHGRSPDFLVADGKCFETKLTRNGVVLFWTSQVAALTGSDCSLVLFEDDNTEPSLIAPYDSLEVPGRHGKFTFKVVSPNPRDKAIINARLNDELLSQLKTEARKQHRSLNNLIEVVLSDWAARLIQYEATGDLK